MIPFRPTRKRHESVIASRLLVPYLLPVFISFLLNGCLNQQARPASAGPEVTVQSSEIAPSPSYGSVAGVEPRLNETAIQDRRPGSRITASAVTADGSIWYAYDIFDGLGGSPPGSPAKGLFRLLDGQVTHFDVPGIIRVLVVAPDGTLTIGAGCGVLQFQNEKLETLLPLNCAEPGQPTGLFPMDITFDHDGIIWVGGAYNLASYDGQNWTEYGFPALRIAVATDGSIWTWGWDGQKGSDCCLRQLSASGRGTYTWSTKQHAPPELHDELTGARAP